MPPPILIADGTHDAEGVAEALRSDGHEVVVVNDAAAADRRVRARGAALVIASTELALESGAQLLHRWKADEVARNIPVVVTGGRNGDEHLLAALEAGATDFLSKPFSLRELALRVRAILRRTAGPPLRIVGE